MGDHRASISIQMSFHGIEKKTEMWINYFPGECEGVDDRVIEFFRNVYEKGMDVYAKELSEYFQEVNKEQIEKDELKELERLKAKYETEENQ